MSWLSRLFSSPPPPPPNSVVIPDDLAATLTADGADLDVAVVGTVRAHLDAQAKAKEAAARGEKIPFWLQKDADFTADLEDELRDRVTQRRAVEAEN